MKRPTGFLIKGMVAGVAAILILGAGLVFSVRRFESVSTAQVTHVRLKENEITAVERLRWSGELVVSVGRGYLISGDTEPLEKLRAAEATFDRNVIGLHSEELSPAEQRLVGDVELSARAFMNAQKELLAERAHADPATIRRRFEDELLPRRRQLERSLNALVAEKEAQIQDVYRQATMERGRLANRLYILLAVLVLVGLAVTWFFARRLEAAHRKEAEALQTARRALVARDELMGIVAHDLRNPLGAITLKAGVLRQRGESQQTRDKAASIEAVAQRMEHLIKGMLDVATIEAGRFSVTPAPCDVAGLIREAVEMFEGLSASRQIQLEPGDGTGGLTINADRERVLQVLSNLLGNALKFTPPGGRVRVGVQRQGAMAHFTVSDTGPGVAAPDAPHVFERYWKRETKGQKGTGLGLFIAKGIVDAHGGRIWVEGEPGRGATFAFTLPVVEPTASASA
jgi:signal transduction histidine kinase